MKQIVITFFITITFFSKSFSQTSVFTEDEKAIYHLLIDQLQANIDSNYNIDKKSNYEIRIRKETINQYNLIDANKRLREEVKEVSVLDDIKTKNKIAYPTKSLEIKTIAAKNTAKLPSTVEVEFSRCGFSAGLALVYFSMRYDKISGYGDLVLLEKDKEGKWKIIKKYTKWAA